MSEWHRLFCIQNWRTFRYQICFSSLIFHIPSAIIRRKATHNFSILEHIEQTKERCLNSVCTIWLVPFQSFLCEAKRILTFLWWVMQILHGTLDRGEQVKCSSSSHVALSPKHKNSWRRDFKEKIQLKYAFLSLYIELELHNRYPLALLVLPSGKYTTNSSFLTGPCHSRSFHSAVNISGFPLLLSNVRVEQLNNGNSSLPQQINLQWDLVPVLYTKKSNILG